MNSVEEVLDALKDQACEQTQKIFQRHGCDIQTYGVQVGRLKTIAKELRDQHELALQLYDTGISDAMYLAAMICDPQRMTKRQLDAWVKAASWSMLSDSAVAPVAAESPHGRDLALKWMKSKKPLIASAGWTTYSLWVGILDDDQLDLDEITDLLDNVVQGIDAAPNRVRYAMNQFVICVGSYVKPLLKKAKSDAKRIGKVEVDMGETGCKVPLATEYIAKVESKGRVGKKRKAARC